MNTQQIHCLPAAGLQTDSQVISMALTPIWQLQTALFAFAAVVSWIMQESSQTT